MVALAVLTLTSGCATCAPEALATRAQWGAPIAVVDQAGFVYRGDVVPTGPWGIPTVVTWGVPCRLPDSARGAVRACTQPQLADPGGPVCYLLRY